MKAPPFKWGSKEFVKRAEEFVRKSVRENSENSDDEDAVANSKAPPLERQLSTTSESSCSAVKRKSLSRRVIDDPDPDTKAAMGTHSVKTRWNFEVRRGNEARQFTAYSLCRNITTPFLHNNTILFLFVVDQPWTCNSGQG